ncbi:MAG: response regulator transcription factor [Anaerolineae bacterium]|nr:response regulator transcription factor [Anaerolineae bacterium]
MRKGRPLILVADDMARYVTSIKIILEANGYEVVAAGDGETALALAATEPLDLILLDIRMPKLDGIETCQRVREFSMVPIIMFTALAEDADKVAGLNAGADDYITKPFSADELIARVRAVLRRAMYSPIPAPQAAVTLGELTVDFAAHRVSMDGQEINLTSTEYRLLCELAGAVGHVLTTDYILEKVWGSGYEGEEHLVWKIIHRLRQKIELDPKQPRYIHTKPGIGYLLELR